MTDSRQEDLYRFGPYRLHAVERVLLRQRDLVPLSPKVFDTLLVLVENSGHIVEKDHLMQTVWPNSFVEESNLTNNISILRKVFGDAKYIQTIPKRGYRFSAGVKRTLRAVPSDLTLQGPIGGKLMFQIPEASGAADERDAEIGQTLVAVLPFKSIGAKEESDHLGLGITDAVITALSKIRHIVVRPTSTILKYRGHAQDPLAAGREQRVDKVLDGCIQVRGERMRVTVQLVSVRDGATVWADKFEDHATDMFGVQDRISERVAKALRLRLTDEERRLLTRRPTKNADAYYLYLKGRYFENRRTKLELQKSVRCFEQAIEADPRYALAYVGLADSYALLAYYCYLSPEEAVAKAKRAVLKALEIDETLAEGHTALAYLKWCYDWDYEGAERQLRRAIELNPNYAPAHQVYSFYLNTMGRLEDSLHEINRAHHLDPTSLIINTSLGLPYYFLRQADRAIELFQRAVDMDPVFWLSHTFLGAAHALEEDYERAIAELRKARRASNSAWLVSMLGNAYAKAGRISEARALIKELAERSKRSYVSPYFTAVIYAGLGKKDLAFHWLEKACREKTCWLVYLRVEPRLDELRSDPRFIDLLRSVHLL